MKKELKFSGIIKNNIFDSGEFKIYSVDVNTEEFPDVKINSFNDVTILGNLHDLVLDMPYNIIGVEERSKYGFAYRVKNIKVKNDDEKYGGTYAFLRSVLTFNQANELYEKYPNIIDLVIKGQADDVVDLSIVKGIKDKTFKKIKEKIIENYVLFDVIAEFDGLLTISILKKIYEKYPSIEKIREMIKIDPYKFFTDLSGVGFKKADSMLLNMQKDGKLDILYDLRTSKERCASAIMFLLQENEGEGHTKINLVELKNEIEKLVPQCSGHFVDCLKEGKQNGEIYYSVDDMVVARQVAYSTEKYIADSIKYALKRSVIWDIDISKYKKIEDGELTEEQINALKNLCENNFSVLVGNAGTGKTASTKAIINMLDDNRKNYLLLAPTGKAARVLGDYTGKKASTIHMGLSYRQGEWGYNEKNKLPIDVVVVDEFSMVDIYLFQTLLKAIDFNRTKLLIVGDNAQLNSVGAGNCLHNIINSGTAPVTELTQIFRYGEGGLMKVATDVRQGKRFLDSIDSQVKVFGKNRDYTFIQVNSEFMIKTMIGLYKKLLTAGNKPQDIMVLAAYNKGDYGTMVINNELQKVVNPNYDSIIRMKVGNITFYKGDIVLQTKNDYKVPINCDPEDVRQDPDSDEEPKITGVVCNGETGVIKEILYDSMIIEFDGVEYVYDREVMYNLLLGYAMSIHKSQGSSSKIVIVLTPSAHTYMTSSNLLYVALTRMKEKCFHLGDLTTINRAIKKKVNLMRNTFLEDFLVE